jgi:hypothetical protein
MLVTGISAGGFARSVVAASDPFWSQVTLLMPMSGADESIIFTDESDLDHAFARTLLPTIDTATDPYSDGLGAYEQLLNNGQTISTPYLVNDFDWFLEDHTIEAWVYTGEADWSSWTGANGASHLIGHRNPTGINDVWSFGPYYNGTGAGGGRLMFYYFNGSQQFIIGTTALPESTWIHVAMTHRASDGRIQLFVDGVLETTTPASPVVTGTPTAAPSDPLTIGAANSASFKGNTADVRITKGVNRYTGNFTPPTARFPTTGPATDILFTNVELLVRSVDATNGQITFTDDSESARTLTRQGDTIYNNAQIKFNSDPTMLFDGSGDDWVSVPDSADLSFADRTVELCIEAWIYITDTTSTCTVINGRDGGSAEEWTFRTNAGATASMSFLVWGSGVNRLNVASAAVITQDTWHHVAVTRKNVAGDGVGQMYVNGVASGVPVTQTIDGTNNTGPYQIGHNAFNNTRDFVGHIDSVRVTRGDIRYDGDFTAPTTPFPAA